MTARSVEQHVYHLVKTILPGNAKRTITRDMDLITDLSADSLSIVSIVFALNEEFDVGTDELGALVQDSRTVGDLIEAVERLQKARN
jgi:acyl carrier protein